MKKMNFPHTWVSLLIAGMIMLLSLSACNTPASNNTQKPEQEKKYTVWTNRSPYKEFKDGFKEVLEDGEYLYAKYTPENWQKVLENITNNSNWGRRSWTEQEIRDWFLDHGFDKKTATERATWLIKTVEHGLIASRTGITVYYLIK